MTADFTTVAVAGSAIFLIVLGIVSIIYILCRKNVSSIPPKESDCDPA